MSEKVKQNGTLLLDESLATPAMLWWLIGIVAVSSIFSGISAAKEVTWITLAVILGCMLFFFLIIGLTYVLFCRRMRLRMDAERIWTHIPLQKDRALAWGQVRTAAIVTLRNMNYPALIVLSIHDPQTALTRKRMVWKNPKRGEELRLPLTDSRRAMIEQQLGMTLPEIEL